MLLTTSEARAEACTVVITLLLRRLTASELRRLHAEAFMKAQTIGEKSVEEEVEFLFHEVKF